MKTAMILAAGRGERLKPLTESIPKALCCIKGVPLIEYHVNKLAKSGFELIVINHAYLGYKIRHHLGNGQRWGVEICYSPEPPGGLETGGGIVQALPWFKGEPFVTVNSDIFTDYDYANLTLLNNQLAHIVLVPSLLHHQPGDFGLENDCIISNSPRQFTHGGITCYHPDFFKHQEIGRFSVTPLLRAMIDKKQITGEVFAGRWHDIGTIERLATAQRLQHCH